MFSAPSPELVALRRSIIQTEPDDAADALRRSLVQGVDDVREADAEAQPRSTPAAGSWFSSTAHELHDLLVPPVACDPGCHMAHSHDAPSSPPAAAEARAVALKALFDRIDGLDGEFDGFLEIESLARIFGKHWTTVRFLDHEGWKRSSQKEGQISLDEFVSSVSHHTQDMSDDDFSTHWLQRMTSAVDSAAMRARLPVYLPQRPDEASDSMAPTAGRWFSDAAHDLHDVGAPPGTSEPATYHTNHTNLTPPSADPTNSLNANRGWFSANKRLPGDTQLPILVKGVRDASMEHLIGLTVTKVNENDVTLQTFDTAKQMIREASGSVQIEFVNADGGTITHTFVCPVSGGIGLRLETPEMGAVQCAVCFESFRSPDRIPRALNCLHTFCSVCLLDANKISWKNDGEVPEEGIISSRSVCCPTCQRDTCVPGGGVDGMLCNYQLLDAATAWNLRQLREHSCNDCGDRATSFCAECWLLCEDCTTAHSKKFATRGHVVQTIEDFRANGPAAPLNRSSRVEYCTVHPERKEMHELSLYCKTCCTAICMACAVMSHKAPEHEYEPLVGQAACRKADLWTLMAKVDLRRAAVDAAADTVTSMKSQVHQRELEAIDSTRNIFDRLRAKIDECEQQALLQTSAVCGAKHSKLESQLAELTLFGRDMDNSCDYVRDAVQQGSDAHLILSGSVLVGRLEELLKQECVLTPETTEQMSLNLELSPVLAELCKLAIPSELALDLAQCTCTQLDETPAVGVLTEFSVVLQDSSGRNIVLPSSGGVGSVLRVQVNVANPNDQVEAAVSVQATILQQEDGSFRCTYTPASATELQVCVLACGQHVGGSPFSVQAEAQKNVWREQGPPGLLALAPQKKHPSANGVLNRDVPQTREEVHDMQAKLSTEGAASAEHEEQLSTKLVAEPLDADELEAEALMARSKKLREQSS